MESRNFRVVLRGDSVADYGKWRDRFVEANYILAGSDENSIVMFVQFPCARRFRTSHDVEFSVCSSRAAVTEIRKLELIEEFGHCRDYDIHERPPIANLEDYIDRAASEVPETLLRRENAMICSRNVGRPATKQKLSIYYIHGGNMQTRTEAAMEILGNRPYNRISCNKKMWHVKGKRYDACLLSEFDDIHVDARCFLDLIDTRVCGFFVPRSFTFNTWSTIVITSKYNPFRIYVGDDEERDRITKILGDTATIINTGFTNK